MAKALQHDQTALSAQLQATGATDIRTIGTGAASARAAGDKQYASQ